MAHEFGGWRITCLGHFGWCAKKSLEEFFFRKTLRELYDELDERGA
jgi:hypothetical protein